jgi:4-hydroxythreonine-4-phosphate dehydrogenase
MKKPIIGITMGEPAGIGPEISVKALCDRKTREICKPFILGDKNTLAEAKKFCQEIKNKAEYNIVGYDQFDSIVFNENEIPVLDFNNVNVKKIRFGEDSAMGGKASGQYIRKAIELALDKKIQAVVTGPISKRSFKLGGWGLRYAGHTEMFAALTRTKKYAMLLADGNFRVIHVTTHTPLRDAVKKITRERVTNTIELANYACKLFGVKKPKISVCGLNPHAGEEGKMGDEEIKVIAPAVMVCRKRGIDVIGPLPADTMWSKVLAGIYDIGVAMYHDQGHIPTKLLGFRYGADGKYKEIEGINITVGIPIIRVSVDHGVAYGKAGKGIASPRSLIQAIETAVVLAKENYRLYATP